MPLCSYDNEQKTNIILVNDDNYILINKKLDENYKLYKLDNNFDIIEITESKEIIEDNIIIPGINKMVNGIHLIQAFLYNNDDIFRNFLSNVWSSGYSFFNRLKDIMYKNFKGQILYQNNINIVLSFIFINKLDYIISLLYNLDTLISDDDIIYHEYKPTKKIKNFNEIKSELLFDYINAFDYIMIDDIHKITSFEMFRDTLNNILSNIEKFNFQDKNDEFNLFMKILKIIYKYIDTEPNIVEQYNYSLYIDKFKDFDIHSNVTTYKSLITFINKYEYETIKNKLILKLSCLIYLCYKTNIELDSFYNASWNTTTSAFKNKKYNGTYRASQYMLLDYFYGITKIKNNCVPINRRQILVKILGTSETELSFKTKVSDETEKEFFKQFTQKFKEIKQYTFTAPIRYTDCGETTILNLFNYLLLNNDGSFNLSDIKTWDIKLKDFYEKYPTMDTMINTNIEIFKRDLSLVFNNRKDQIDYNNKENECDINTSMYSIIKTCAILLNIKTDNFIDIFKKLNNKVKDTDIRIYDEDTVVYSNKFELKLREGHGEFRLFSRKIFIEGIQKESKYYLNDHWLNNARYSRTNFPCKYSLEHFKFLLKNIERFFYKNFPPELQTEEMCIEAVNGENYYLYYDPREGDVVEAIRDELIVNYNKIINKTYKISVIAVSVYSAILKYVPKNLLKDLCLIAFNRNPLAIKYIPYEFQDINMLNKLYELYQDTNLYYEIIHFIDPVLLQRQ